MINHSSTVFCYLPMNKATLVADGARPAQSPLLKGLFSTGLMKNYFGFFFFSGASSSLFISSS